MSRTDTHLQAIALNDADTRSRRAALSVIFGLLFMASSYTFEKLNSPLFHHGGLAVGTLFLVLPAAESLCYPINWTSVLKCLGFLGLIEFLNVMHLDRPFEVRSLMQRIVCYVAAMTGLILAKGTPHSSRNTHVPWFLHLTIVAYSCLTAAFWLKDATEMAGVRFSGDSELLTPVGVGYSFGVLACISTAFLLIERNSWLRALHIISYCCCLLAILSTGSRGSAAFCILITVGGALLRLQSLSDVVRLLGTLSVLVVLLILVIKSNEYASTQLDFTLNRFSLLSTGQVDSSMVIRQEIRTDYYESMPSWIIFGYSGYDYAYPHNVFFECILRFGIIGFGIAFAIVYAVVRAVAGLRTISDQPLVWVISCVGLFTVLVVQVNLMLEHARFLWLFVGFWCFMEWKEPLRFEIQSPSFTFDND